MVKLTKLKGLVISGLWMLLAFQAQGIKDVQAAEVDRLIAAAKENGERELNISWAEQSFGGSKGAKMFEALFNRMYGTNIKVNFTPSPSMRAMTGKIIQEVTAGRKPSTNVFLGTETHYGTMLKRDIMEPYDYTKLSARIPRGVVTRKNIGVEIATFVSGITYNTNLISPAEAPKKMEDALNPKWKGKIASTPYAAQFDRFAALSNWGNEKMEAFVTKLSRNVGGLIRCGEMSRISSGEFIMMVMDCGSYYPRLERAKGAPLAHVTLEDGATISYFYWGIPRNSPNSNLAKLFINMAMSREGQKVVYKNYATDHYELPGSQTSDEIKGLRSRGIEVLDINAEYVADNSGLRPLSRKLSKILRQKR